MKKIYIFVICVILIILGYSSGKIINNKNYAKVMKQYHDISKEYATIFGLNISNSTEVYRTQYIFSSTDTTGTRIVQIQDKIWETSDGSLEKVREDLVSMGFNKDEYFGYNEVRKNPIEILKILNAVPDSVLNEFKITEREQK